MPADLTGKVALVTGGSSGIGRAAALGFAARGASVAIAARGIPLGEEAVAAIRATGAEAEFFRTDVSVTADVEALIGGIARRFGRLDYALNNAAVEDVLKPTAECTEENWDRVINTNLKGVWLCMKYEIRQMLTQGGGSIVNVLSVMGLRGMPGMPAYSAAKGGVLQLTRTAAIEYVKANIRINAVCPGGVITPLSQRVVAHARESGAYLNNPHRMERWVQPEEFAETIVWLCADAPQSVIGHTLVADDGWSIQ